MNLRRTVPTAVAGLVLAAFAAPAFAEGNFTSSMTNWLPGNETRSWDDKNQDDVATTFGAKQCSYDTQQSAANITMELNRNDTWTPDEHYGNKTLVCTSTSAVHTVSWGDKGKGNFDMTLKKVDGETTSYKGRLSAKYVHVTY
jgi:hypothetical protein